MSDAITIAIVKDRNTLRRVPSGGDAVMGFGRTLAAQTALRMYGEGARRRPACPPMYEGMILTKLYRNTIY
jgi:hypothetical protein